MYSMVNDINEQKSAAAFNNQAAVFDSLYSSDQIIKYKRQRVREHVVKYVKPHSNILELNSGTGEDAIFFAEHGHRVHATDIADGMQTILIKKIADKNYRESITTELCSFTNLKNLKYKGPFDVIFSNFAGLNCTDKLDKVLPSFHSLLNTGGIVTLVLLPQFCLWETLLCCKGAFTIAFRRFFSRHGRKAHIEGEFFNCWYYNPSFVIKHLKKDFDLLSVEGLCTIVPPSYFKNFAEKHPRIFSWLKKMENKYSGTWPWKYIGDYYIISFRKK